MNIVATNLKQQSSFAQLNLWMLKLNFQRLATQTGSGFQHFQSVPQFLVILFHLKWRKSKKAFVCPNALLVEIKSTENATMMEEEGNVYRRYNIEMDFYSVCFMDK